MAEKPLIFTPSALMLTEGTWDEHLHPRGRGGKWIDKLGDMFRGEPTVLGTTPYLKSRVRERGQRTPKSFQQAADLHLDPKWRPTMDNFEQSAEALAEHHGVKLVQGERNVGVFEGDFEPSYAVKVRGDKAKIDAFNQDLGRQYGQKAVVGFTPNRKGHDMEVQLEGGENPDSFYQALVGVMGKDAGIAYDEGVWRVFVYKGQRDVVDKIDKLAKANGIKPKLLRGDGDYFTLRRGEG